MKPVPRPPALSPLLPKGVLLAVGAAFLLGGCGEVAKGESEGPREYASIEWMDLLPGADFEALMNPPAWLDDIEEGSEADQVDSARLQRDPVGRRYLEALTSTAVVAEKDQQAVRLPGFVVPLEFDDRQRVTEFFLVPWFGACLHLPPPPPNQMLHVRYPRGLDLARLEDAFWVEGTLETTIVNREIGTSAYALDADLVRPYFLEGD
ncbi:MAG: DUF3299 domain-containing protein [Gemmatimonadales bacterium]|nr:MAG: DUF3299 domain-containing protein [Gemmatimonadales bacterium]